MTWNERLAARAPAIKGLAILCIILFHYTRAELGRPNDVQWTFTPDVLSQFTTLIGEAPNLLFYHLMQFFGYLGVPVFFILSGWGLAYSRLNKNGEESYKTFIKLRMGRLLPMYYLSLALFGTLFLLSYLNQPDLIANLLLDLLAKALLLHNFVPQYTFSFNSVYWFVPTLLVLYLLFPVLYKMVKSRPVITLCGSITLAYVLSHGLLTPAIHDIYPAWAMGAFPLTRIAEFTLGIYLACAGQGRPSRADVKIPLIAIAALTAGVYSYCFLTTYPLHNILWGIGLIYLCLIIPQNKQLSPFHRVGLISFPLFLFHRPFIPPWQEFIAPHLHTALALIGYLLFIGIFCWITDHLYNRYMMYRKAIREGST